MEVTNRYVVVKTHVEAMPSLSDFELKSESLKLSVEPGSKDVIVRNLYVSIDPYQLNRMKSNSNSQRSGGFAIGIVLGKEIDAYGLAKVVVSDKEEFAEGDLVVGLISWGEYTKIGSEGILRKLDPMGFPLSYHVGVLGFSGLTAYAGLFEVCKLKPGEKVFVSAACGSVGNLVGQYAKLLGCYVVGSAGTKKKVDLLKEKLGFDDAFNYREEPDLKSTLQRYFPDGIDVYFDNVGAEMQEAAVDVMNRFGRVAVCGVISEYTNTERRAAPNMLDVIYKRIKIQGFLAADHVNILADFISTTAEYLRSGKMIPVEDISEGVESVPTAFMGLFRGDNMGKKIVKIGQE
ncbi:hypothetical protein MLD38_005757 [Melastoma candidum]|uniref:Uncharacterized protein n=1 Tax=Melastoma candidum TaxID=119954 RepID=A0ACB9RU45_9MYRT|nr:hypothetical protein MLD38_005757 [Melastoma candidum]